MRQYIITKCSLIFAIGFAVIGIPASAQVSTISVDNSITCIESRFENLNQTEEGRQQLAGRNLLQIGEECSKEHKWTLRKATAASLYTTGKILLKKGRESWLSSGYALDLPDRIQKRMNFKQFSLLVLDGNYAIFQKILAEELVVTGSKINADDSIDKLSLHESNVVGEKLGRIMASLAICDETIKFFNDPTHQSPYFIRLFTTINPKYAEILSGLE